LNPFKRFPGLSPDLVKYGTLLYVSGFKELGEDNDTLIASEYLGRCDIAVKEATEGQAYAELAYGCYAMCNYGFISGQGIDATARYAKVFLQSFKNLKDTTKFLLVNREDWMGRRT
jgi:hypothetical protein